MRLWAPASRACRRSRRLWFCRVRTMPDAFRAVAAILRNAIAERVTPAAVIEVGRSDGPLWREAFGTLFYDRDAAPATPETIFDLASLTKVTATATLAMRALDESRVDLDDPVRRWLPEWNGSDRQR